jgi:hypothetical protein
LDFPELCTPILQIAGRATMIVLSITCSNGAVDASLFDSDRGSFPFSGPRLRFVRHRNKRITGCGGYCEIRQAVAGLAQQLISGKFT